MREKGKGRKGEKGERGGGEVVHGRSVWASAYIVARPGLKKGAPGGKQQKTIGVPGREPTQGWRGHVQAGPSEVRAHLEVHREEHPIAAFLRPLGRHASVVALRGDNRQRRGARRVVPLGGRGVGVAQGEVQQTVHHHVWGRERPGGGVWGERGVGEGCGWVRERPRGRCVYIYMCVCVFVCVV